MTKLGFQNGKGQTYEGMLTVESIAMAQKYYDLLVRIKNGEDELKISEKVKKVLPDFPKVAITFSVTENEESSQENQAAMDHFLVYYNKMYGTKFGVDRIQAYNGNLNDRLARKEKRYKDREQQIDLVIVVDRLLTGFDAPCLSTLFIDRPPMSPQGLIQAFSRTNRLFDQGKQYGQIVTFRNPKEYKDKINEALVLYSRGGTGEPIAEDWDTVLGNFARSLKTIRAFAPDASEVGNLSTKQKWTFIRLFRDLDHDLAHLKSFSTYTPEILDEYDFSQEVYDDYAAAYKNALAELPPRPPADDPDEPDRDDYELIAFSKLVVDFEYIVELLQGFIDTLETDGEYSEEEFAHKIASLRELVNEFESRNPKLSRLLLEVLDDIASNKEYFIGKDISSLISDMRTAAIEKEIIKYADKWYVPVDDVRYEVYHFKDGELSNENNFKDKADYGAYKESTPDALAKFKFRSAMVEEFKEGLMSEIGPLII